MKIKHLFKFVLLAVLFHSALCAQSLDELQKQWMEHRYQSVLPKLYSHWKQPDGKTGLVEYMIGTSACRIDGYHENGILFLQDLLNSFQLTEAARRSVENEVESCRQTGSNDGAQASFNFVPVISQDMPHVAGKGGYIFYSGATLTNSRFALTPISASDLQKRRYPLAEADKALAGAEGRMGQGSTGVISGHFVVTSASRDPNSSKRIANCIQRFEPPLQKQFEMEPPSYVVSVYAVPNLEEIGRFARKLHGVELPYGTLAYSVYQDMSIVGLGDSESCGSLAHELVHLLIRRNFGNSPPWLEEGLASEVAVGSPKAEAFEFGRSWRDQMLDAQWNLRPTVAQLLEMSWTSFSATSPEEMKKVAAIHAMAAVFVRYLAEKKQLVPIYMAVRDHRFSADLTERRSDGELMEKLLGKKLDAVDADFVSWFRPPRGPSPVPSPHPAKN